MDMSAIECPTDVFASQTYLNDDRFRASRYLA
jgi:hypothetical protein